jgi:excinuclease ABC subunit A
MAVKDVLLVRGAEEHNLKNVTVEIPKNQFVVFTGVSGSGKSSLAFDTIFAEGQRRYVESLSSYARQFLGQMDKPHYESIKGLSPTISIEQKAASKNPRSTVGTITEIYDYLRVLFARAGRQHCHECDRPVAAQTAEQIVDEILLLPTGSKFTLMAPVIENRKGEHRDILEELQASGFARARIDGVPVRLDEEIKLEKNKKHSIEVIVDRLKMKEGILSRLTDSVETALRLGKGTLTVSLEGEDEKVFSEARACVPCGISFPELAPQSFSFNSPLGMCKSCNGLGKRLEMDPEQVIPDPSLSLRQGAVKPWTGMEGSWMSNILDSLVEHVGLDLDKPFQELSTEHRQLLLYGAGKKRFQVKWRRKNRRGTSQVKFEGIMNTLERRFQNTTSEAAKRYYAKFMHQTPCETCAGKRLRPESLAVRFQGRGIDELCEMPVAELQKLFKALKLKGGEALIAKELLREIRNRLRFLVDVGLNYLSLSRVGPTLSGGEAQRIRLASQIGSELTGVLYVLDEPSIGLHQRDNDRLLKALLHLRDLGNSIIVVEHDEDTILAADHVLDFGPGAGVHGGSIVAQGPPEKICRSRKSLTGKYLSGRERIAIPSQRREADPERALVLETPRQNNLVLEQAHFPLGCLVAVTGVSGAGKSSLVNGILYPALARELNGSSRPVGEYESFRGLDLIDKVIDIDQSPIGRTPRSNPATYTGVWGPIREVLAGLKESKIRGFGPGRFSFNVKGGRCEACAGGGTVKVEMHFLADVFVRCEVCNSRRFNEATLAVRFKGLNVFEILELTVDEAAEVFSAHRRVSRVLETLRRVGLGYIHLGQSSPTLSGGEAQRIKLSKELSKRSTGRTVYILDEPTTGLHFHDVRALLGVLQELVDQGNTVIVIEHNLDVIKCADWILDLGPEGGAAGGRLVAEGTPEQVAKMRKSFTGRHLKKLLG